MLIDLDGCGGRPLIEKQIYQHMVV